MIPLATIYRPLTILFLAASLEAMPQWSQATLSQHRTGMAACSSGSKALFAGGGSQASYMTRVDVYEAQTDSWSIADP